MYNIYDNGDYLLGNCRDVKRVTKDYIRDYKEEESTKDYEDLLKDLEDNYKDNDIVLISYNDYTGCYVKSVFKDWDVINYDK